LIEFSAISEYVWTPAAILTGLESIALFVAGVWIARQRSRSSPALRRFSALVLLSAATLGALALSYAAPGEPSAMAWVRLALLLCPWIPLFLYALIGTLGHSSRIALPAILAAAVLSVAGSRTSLIATGFEVYWWGRYPQGSTLGLILIGFWITMVGISAVRMADWLRESAATVGRQRARELLLVLAAGALGAMDFVASLGIGVPPVGSLFFMVVCLRVALDPRVRERLFPVTIEMASEQVVEAMADAVVVLDAGGRIVVVNHALESMLGYSSSELRGEPFGHLVSSSSDASHSDRLKAVLGGRTVRDIERVLRTKSGEETPVSISMAALSGDDEGVVLVIRDIRARKEVEAEVKQTASLLRSILDSTNDAILVVGADGTLHAWNRRLEELFGLDEVGGIRADSTAALEMVLSRLKSGSVFADEIMRAGAGVSAGQLVVLEMHDGRFLECSSVPHRLDGVSVGQVWSLAEVTERRRAETALRESERRYRLLFERNAAGVYRASLDGRIIDCNDAYARMFGWPRASDLISMSCLQFFFDREERDSLVSMLRDVGSLTGVELRLRRRDGREGWVMENLTLVESPDAGAVVEGTLVDISSLKIAEEQMEFQAYHDVLTVLPNRRLFIDRLTLALAHARRTNASLAVMFIDLDHFKNVNDTLGHTAGDELLLTVAERLRRAVREEDTVARIGGDEFTILTAGLREPQDAIVVAEKILSSVARPVEIGGTHLSVSASIGIAFHPDDGDEPEALIKSADSALYRAKELGRNNYQLCTPQLKVRAVERMTLETELRESMSRGELVLHYQPVVRLDTGEITSVEALVRWSHRRRGLVMPAAFMGVAETSRLCIPLDLWVIEEACRQLRVWKDSGLGRLSMSVNLSLHHLQQKELPRKIETILSEHGVAPDHLELEVTEKAILDSKDVSVPLLRELREMGVSIAIDDFGTGYTSLNYLKHLPVDSVKIDRSMVGNLPLNAGDAALVASIISVARLLNLRVVAEGVETAEQVRLLRQRRCNEMQGHLFSAALPAEALQEVLERSGSAEPAIDVISILGSPN
jgi:diguanylate cyclase (GGDEF)-like protein/PAS domain S-box-containing protein